MCTKQGMTVFLAIKKHTSVFKRFTGKHFKIEEMKTFVIEIFYFLTKVGFLDCFFRLSSTAPALVSQVYPNPPLDGTLYHITKLMDGRPSISMNA